MAAVIRDSIVRLPILLHTLLCGVSRQTCGTVWQKRDALELASLLYLRSLWCSDAPSLAHLLFDQDVMKAIA